MGWYCWMCGRIRANEAFSGKGRRQHVCKKCKRMPRESRRCIEALDDIYEFLEQKNISTKNITRLRELCQFPSPHIRALAELVLRVALVAPRLRKRRGYVYHNHPDLYQDLVGCGVFQAWEANLEPPDWPEAPPEWDQAALADSHVEWPGGPPEWDQADVADLLPHGALPYAGAAPVVDGAGWDADPDGASDDELPF